MDGGSERQSKGNPRSDDNEGSEDETSVLDLLCLVNGFHVLLAVGCSGAVDKEVYEPAPPVRSISEGGVQWSTSHITEWCRDSDTSGDGDQRERDDVNGRQ